MPQYQSSHQRRFTALSLMLCLFALYLLIYRGGFHSVDELSMFSVTESLAKFGAVNTNQIAWTQWTTTQAEAQGFFGQDGQVYSKKGLALSLAQLPLYWLALLIPGLGMLQTVSLLNALLTALTGGILFMFLWRLDYSRQTSLITSLIFGTATIATVYAKYLFSEPLAGFLLLLTAYMLFTYRQEGGLRHLLIAGLAAGLAVVTRANNLFLLPCFGLYLLWIVWAHSFSDKQTLKISKTFRAIMPVMVFVLAVAFSGLILMFYNDLRSGDPFQTGYDLTLFSANVLLGFYKLLFSPLRGFFIYSPILLLSLLGWWQTRHTHPAEAWLLASCIGVTLALFSAWSSGEGLSWGSRFLVPLVPFFTLCLAPVVEHVIHKRPVNNLLRGLFVLLLLISMLIQLVAVTINPWVFLNHLQTNFGGEFFLERTDALYDFRYSQIAGQLQMWTVENSDLIWWQPWGFDGVAFTISLFGLILASSTLWQLSHRSLSLSKAVNRNLSKVINRSLPKAINHNLSKAINRSLSKAINRNLSKAVWFRQTQSTLMTLSHPTTLLMLTSLTLLLSSGYLLTRYQQIDRQFGPPDDPYSQALAHAVSDSSIINVAQYHYHIPMNRFKPRMSIFGFAQQTPPLPQTALSLLKQATMGDSVWLITIGFPPGAPDNATERWLTFNAYKAHETWFDDVRLIRYSTEEPTMYHALNLRLGDEIRLMDTHFMQNRRAGQLLPVQLTWQPYRQPSADYQVFLQLLNQDGALVAQHDNPPNGGYTNTSTWFVGQRIVSQHALDLPTELPADDYRLIAGLYHTGTGERLTVAPLGLDFVELGIVRIMAP